MPTSARELVYRTLSRWTALSDPPFLPERTEEGWQALAPRDRAFAYDVLTGVIRWRGMLDAVIASRLRQPLDSLDLPVRALLWIGAYQLLLQSGTAAYAAVDSTVELARKLPAATRAGGLINAVLRGITRLHPTLAPLDHHRNTRRAVPVDFEKALTFFSDLFPNPHAATDAYLAATLSHPVPYVKHLRTLFGDARATELLIRNNLRPPITLRVDSDALDAPAAAGLVAHAGAPCFVVAAEGWNPAVEALVARGTLSPQDPTSAKTVRALAAGEEKPKRILDLCAGMGTKSLQLARTFPEAEVIATDIDHPKLSRLEARARQVKQANLRVRPIADVSAETYDLVLVDVPCSNTGVMGKRVQSRWRWPALDHAALHALQEKLLRQGASLVSPAGRLVYSTCSIDPAENEAIARKAADPGAGYRVLMEETTLPSLANDPTTTHDGGYFCVLARTAP
jgi:16S rRNA (cytosine967-C5)-methyltransferase